MSLTLCIDWFHKYCLAFCLAIMFFCCNRHCKSVTNGILFSLKFVTFLITGISSDFSTSLSGLICSA